MSKTTIKKCEYNCKNEYQDKRYGDGKRVMNEKVNGKYICTVCNKENK